MNLKLQRFDYRSSSYERPNQEFVCGRLAQGKPCLVGPGPGGVCRAGAECRPLNKNGRWVCTRSDAAGGKCADGPLPDGSCCNPLPPCSPKPSIRRQRGMLTRYAIAAVVGLLMVLGGGIAGEAVFSPGPLSASHSEIGGCASCHSVAGEGLVGWAHAVFDSGTEESDMKNCVSCHENRGGLAHNLSVGALVEATERAESLGARTDGPIVTRVAETVGLGVRHADNGEVACRSCHQEHRGHKADITELSNTECQACHTDEFDGSVARHQEFGAYPYERRTRIQFNHQSHIAKYFTDAQNKDKAPRSCRSCHEPDDRGRLMVFTGFDQSCAACHAEFIATKPVVALNLPGLDVDSLIDLEADTGEWPLDAEGEEINAISDILMSHDPAYVEARDYIEENLDLFDLEDVDDEELAYVETYLWAYKELLYDILTEGTAAVSERLNASAETQIPDEQVRALMANLNVDALLVAQTKWFPNLFEEVEAHRDGDEIPMPEDEPEILELSEDAMDGASWAETGGWYTEDFTLNYRLTGHGDMFMRDWLNLSVSMADNETMTGRLMSELAGARSPGGCVECHSIDKVEGGGVVNWKTRRPDPHTVEFTDFYHSKHFALIGDKGCATCHELNADSEYAKGFSDFDPATFSSNFSPLSQDVCAECHTASLAGNDCTSCHNYHVGSFPPAAVETEMVAAE